MEKRLVILMSLFVMGCSQTAFEAKKSSKLSEAKVFGDADRAAQPGMNGTDGGISVPGSGSGSGGLPNFPGAGSHENVQAGPGPGYNPVGGGRSYEQNQSPVPLQANELRFTLRCSDNGSRQATNFKRAHTLNLPVELRINHQICSTNITQIRNLLIGNSITLAALKAICPGVIGNSKIDFAAVMVNGWQSQTRQGPSVQGSPTAAVEVLWARNSSTTEPTEVADEHCDQRSSPLVVHVASDANAPRAIDLSSQADGVNFDLLGASNGYQKVRISWFTNSEYMMLALPNARGEVRGINELFGDQTLGPDQATATDGYAALAKYDGTTADGIFRTAQADGLIDRRDAVYSRLRLWLDSNRDGIGQAGEMYSLRQLGIAFVDLTYSTDFAESDQYGNETKMKSVVGYTDGSLDLIFDLWFAYQD